MKCNDPFSALEDIEIALTLEPENPVNYIDAGIVYQHFNAFISAKLCWGKVIRLDPQGQYREQIRNYL